MHNLSLNNSSQSAYDILEYDEFEGTIYYRGYAILPNGSTSLARQVLHDGMLYECQYDGVTGLFNAAYWKLATTELMVQSQSIATKVPYFTGEEHAELNADNYIAIDNFEMGWTQEVNTIENDEYGVICSGLLCDNNTVLGLICDRVSMEIRVVLAENGSPSGDENLTTIITFDISSLSAYFDDPIKFVLVREDTGISTAQNLKLGYFLVNTAVKVNAITWLSTQTYDETLLQDSGCIREIGNSVNFDRAIGVLYRLYWYGTGSIYHLLPLEEGGSDSTALTSHPIYDVGGIADGIIYGQTVWVDRTVTFSYLENYGYTNIKASTAYLYSGNVGFTTTSFVPFDCTKYWEHTVTLPFSLTNCDDILFFQDENLPFYLRYDSETSTFSGVLLSKSIMNYIATTADKALETVEVTFKREILSTTVGRVLYSLLLNGETVATESVNDKSAITAATGDGEITGFMQTGVATPSVTLPDSYKLEIETYKGTGAIEETKIVDPYFHMATFTDTDVGETTVTANIGEQVFTILKTPTITDYALSAYNIPYLLTGESQVPDTLIEDTDYTEYPFDFINGNIPLSPRTAKSGAFIWDGTDYWYPSTVGASPVWSIL